MARAMDWWMGSESSKLDRRIHPEADVLSPMLNRTVKGSIGGPNRISITRPTQPARNSRVFRDARPTKWAGNLYLQVTPELMV